MRTKRIRPYPIMFLAPMLLGITGCLGPNPGFFISTSAANATIFTLVNGFLSQFINFAAS